MNEPFNFNVTGTDGQARCGLLDTARGPVQTPVFMPVGTQGSVKALRHDDLELLGVEIILANTYHLFLRPGEEVIRQQGGLHRFIGWPKPMLTDSGGFQVFSLAHRRVIDEDGVTFQSHIDGTSHRLTTERAVDIQAGFASDIAMVLDECIAYPATHEEAARAMERSARWAHRCRERFVALQDLPTMERSLTTSSQAQFGIVQGGVFEDLRQASVDRTVAIGFEGYAIGGLSVGEPQTEMYAMAEAAASRLPADRPRYLMGVGTPEDLVECVARGVDMFDCVMPTRHARNGQLFTSQGRINIRNARYAEDDRPLDTKCGCFTCRRHSRAYLRHLFMAGEMTAATLNTLHNLTYYLDTIRRIRESIVLQTFGSFRKDFLDKAGNLPPGS